MDTAMKGTQSLSLFRLALSENVTDIQAQHALLDYLTALFVHIIMPKTALEQVFLCFSFSKIYLLAFVRSLEGKQLFVRLFVFFRNCRLGKEKKRPRAMRMEIIEHC
jgi:hypothetical protein